MTSKYTAPSFAGRKRQPEPDDEQEEEQPANDDEESNERYGSDEKQEEDSMIEEPAPRHQEKGAGDEDDFDTRGKKKINFKVSNRLYKEAVLDFMGHHQIKMEMTSDQLARLVRDLSR